MAKIIKVGSQNITPNKIANPFRTSRNSATNPFKYSNFEGNTLQFADVFEGFETKNANNSKLVATSVTGSMSKIRTRIAEPIIKFVNRIREGLHGAYEYATNTNISDVAGFRTIAKAINYANTTDISEVAGFKHISKALGSLSDGISNGISGIKKGITSGNEILSADVTELGKVFSARWTDLISKINNKNKISANTPVNELEQLWRNEIELERKVA